MKAELVLKDGKSRSVERHPTYGWYVVRGSKLDLGDFITIDGIRREVVVVAELNHDQLGIHVLPDFEDPGCQACGQALVPPTPEWCRLACGGRNPY